MECIKKGVNKVKGYGKKIAHYRKKIDMSQDDLGSRLGVTRSYISKIENEKTPISLETLGNIAQILGVSPVDLIDNQKQEPPSALKDAGAKWMILGEKLEKEGFTTEQIEAWAKIVKMAENKE
jgi:transcriptional regulator with XRE-family HTH domain